MRDRMKRVHLRLNSLLPRLIPPIQGMELRSERLIPGRLRMEQVPPRMRLRSYRLIPGRLRLMLLSDRMERGLREC